MQGELGNAPTAAKHHLPPIASSLARQAAEVAAAVLESPLAVEEEPVGRDPLALVGLGDGGLAAQAAWGSPPEMQEELGSGGGGGGGVPEPLVVASGSPLAMQEELVGGSDGVAGDP